MNNSFLPFNKNNKKAQSASGSAILIIIITVLIVLYILFLPPADRVALLSDDSSGGVYGPGSSSSGTNSFHGNVVKLLLNENPGHLNGLQKDSFEHYIPSFRIGTKKEGRVLNEVDSFLLKHSSFDFKAYNLSFILDKTATSGVKLSFNVGDDADGKLIILLNGKLLVEKSFEPDTSHYINLPFDSLRRTNVLSFMVSGPGWMFWKSNVFQLKDVKVAGTVVDDTNSESSQIFSIGDDEFSRIDKASLRYHLDCNPNSVGKLRIEVNGKVVFNSVGDCGLTNTIELDKNILFSGENEITFITDYGVYLVDSLLVRTYMKSPSNPIYYFTINDNYFSSNSRTPVCGDIDGVCPDDCSPDLDKDCCFQDKNNYWCDLETAQLDDRCVSFVTESTCDRCESGYEDYRGRPADACKGLCGDDTDRNCPDGCSRLLDKDCCFDAGDTYWCDDIPYGKPLSAVCKFGVEPDERTSCPSYYYDANGRRLKPESSSSDDSDSVLKSHYKVVLDLRFPDDSVKDLVLLVNGREIGVAGRELDYSFDISDYVMPGTNSLELLPRKSVDIASLKVSLES